MYESDRDKSKDGKDKINPFILTARPSLVLRATQMGLTVGDFCSNLERVNSNLEAYFNPKEISITYVLTSSLNGYHWCSEQKVPFKDLDNILFGETISNAPLGLGSRVDFRVDDMGKVTVEYEKYEKPSWWLNRDKLTLREHGKRVAKVVVPGLVTGSVWWAIGGFIFASATMALAYGATYLATREPCFAVTLKGEFNVPRSLPTEEIRRLAEGIDVFIEETSEAANYETPFKLLAKRWGSQSPASRSLRKRDRIPADDSEEPTGL